MLTQKQADMLSDVARIRAALPFSFEGDRFDAFRCGVQAGLNVLAPRVSIDDGALRVKPADLEEIAKALAALIEGTPPGARKRDAGNAALLKLRLIIAAKGDENGADGRKNVTVV